MLRRRWAMPSRAHKIRLDPTNKQATALARAAGCARFAYNWALGEWGRQHEAHKCDPKNNPKPSQYSLRKELNAIKRAQFPWMLESTKCAPQEAIIDLGKAFASMWDGRGRYPRFKKRGINDSFRLSSGQFAVKGRLLRVPNVGWVRLTESLRFEDGRPTTVTISCRAGCWYASILCEVSTEVSHAATGVVLGVDVGVREYVTSDGTRYEVPRALRACQGRLTRAQRDLARKEKGSVNRKKARARVARLHQRVSSQRADWLHKLTTDIANRADVVVIEDLNVAGMLRNRRLALSVSEASFGEFRRHMEYKTIDRGTELVVADRWYPSSKLCSVCGTKTKSLPLGVRRWVCGDCGVQHDRDLNAARNLASLVKTPTAASSAVAACGAFCASTPAMGPSPDAPPLVQAPATKQELDTTSARALLDRF